MQFDSPSAYLEALQSNPKLAIVPLQMVADLRGITRAAVDGMLRSGRLQEIKIENSRYVSAESIIELQFREEDRVNKVENFLKELAASRKTVTYEPIMASVGLSSKIPSHRTAIGKILGDITRRSWEQDGILLTVLVHHKMASYTRPGRGFFNLAAELGVPPWKDEEEMVARETQRVWDFYAKAAS